MWDTMSHNNYVASCKILILVIVIGSERVIPYMRVDYAFFASLICFPYAETILPMRLITALVCVYLMSL